jgi:hypothetical protein
MTSRRGAEGDPQNVNRPQPHHDGVQLGMVGDASAADTPGLSLPANRAHGARMEPERRLLRHFVATLAYRTQKALRGAPPEFASFRVAPETRTPHELVRHRSGVLHYALSLVTTPHALLETLPTLGEEVLPHRCSQAPPPPPPPPPPYPLPPMAESSPPKPRSRPPSCRRAPRRRHRCRPRARRHRCAPKTARARHARRARSAGGRRCVRPQRERRNRKRPRVKTTALRVTLK